MAITLGELAVRFGCTVRGEPAVEVDSVATLENAGRRSISFLANPKYRRHLATTRAAAVVIEPRFADECPVAALISANAYATYARIATLLHPEPTWPPGVDASARIGARTRIAPTASIAAAAVVEDDVEIGDRSRVGPGCVVMQGSRIGDDTRLSANVTLCRGVKIGARVLIHPGVVIGADGFGLAMNRDRKSVV